VEMSNSDFDNINMDLLCDGCLIYEQHKIDPVNNVKCIGYIVKDTNCPCQRCLLKMMCITTCEAIEERKWPASYRRHKSE
jgi:hypothetical protein